MTENILITGASQGLGKALALHFSRLGHHVYAVGRNKNKLQALTDNHPNIHAIIADITSQSDRQTIYEAMQEKAFSIIHNAGIADPNSFKQLPEDVLRAHVETNVIAPLLLTQHLLPLLTPHQRILHISSGAAWMALDGLTHYCVTKAAMQHAMICLNKELRPLNIPCGNVSPGLMNTGMVNNWFELDKTKLPSKDYYMQLKQEAKLVDPELAAIFVAWVMLNTTDSEFSETIWNIYDTSYQHRWLPEDRTVPLPPE